MSNDIFGQRVTESIAVTCILRTGCLEHSVKSGPNHHVLFIFVDPAQCDTIPEQPQRQDHKGGAERAALRPLLHLWQDH